MKKIYASLILLFISNILFAEVSSLEKNALVKLYETTNGHQWTKTWDLKSPVSTWYGVKVVNDKVIALDLSKNNLVGTLPSEIANLTYLQTINLYKNETSYYLLLLL